jgi:hypothetical protein
VHHSKIDAPTFAQGQNAEVASASSELPLCLQNRTCHSRIVSLFCNNFPCYRATNSLFLCVGKPVRSAHGYGRSHQYPSIEPPISINFPVFFPVIREFGAGDGFESHCRLSQPVVSLGRVSALLENLRDFRRLPAPRRSLRQKSRGHLTLNRQF